MSVKILIAESGTGYGGSAKYLASLLPLLDRSRFSIEVVTYGGGPLIQQLIKEGRSVHYFEPWRFPWKLAESQDTKSPIGKIMYAFLCVTQLMVTIPVVMVWLYRNQIELVHLNNEILSHLPLLLAARLMGCQVICHFHGWRNLTSTEKMASRYVDKFVAVTQSGADFYSWQLNGRSVQGIPNGLTIEDNKEQLPEVRINMRKDLGLQDTDFLAILIGRFIPLKGHSVFFQAIAKAQEKNSNIRGLVVGNDPSPNGQYLQKLKSELKNLGIEGHISFLPWQDHMGPIYESSDVVVQPSIEPESFGYVALEGMAAGKPVIASRIGGLIDVIQDGRTGFLVQPGNSDELSKAILRVARDPSFASELGVCGRERAKTVFTMSHNTERIQEVYAQLLNPAKILIAESGSGYGGTAKYLTNLLSCINRNEFQVEVVSYGDGPFIQEIERNWHVYRRKSWRFPWGEKEEVWGKVKTDDHFLHLFQYAMSSFNGVIQFLILVPSIFLWLKRKKIKIVHLNNGIRSHLPLLIASHFAGSRIICHFHGWRLFTHTEQWFTPWVDQFIAISEAGAHLLRSRIRAENVIAIPNGLPISYQIEKSTAKIKAERSILGIPEQAKVISIIGRLVEWKGQDVYLKALAKVIRDHSEVIGIILGHDPTQDQQYLKKLKALSEELNISSHVRFLPWQEDVKTIYSLSDIVVHASTDPEPFGLVILEAMFAQKPIVATKGGGVSDLMIDGKTGILVEPKEVDQLAHELNRLVSDSKFAKELAEAGEHRAKMYFSMERNGTRVQELYFDLLSSHQRKTRGAFGKLPWRSNLKQAMFVTGALNVIRNSIGSKVPILMYHKISNERDPFFPSISEKTFREQMHFIKRCYNILSLDQLIQYLSSQEKIPHRSVVVTFDDGNAPTLSLASPILKEFEIPATVFLSADPTRENRLIWTDLLRWWIKLTSLRHYAIHINGYAREWKLTDVMERMKAGEEISMKLKTLDNEHREKMVGQLEIDFNVDPSKLPKDWLLTESQIKHLSKSNIQFGAHTVTHPILSKMSLSEARYEIFESKKWLESILNEKIKHFAYPNGEADDFGQEHEHLVAQAGFESGSSTVLGLNDSKTNRYALKRIYAADEPLASFASRLVGIGS